MQKEGSGSNYERHIGIMESKNLALMAELKKQLKKPKQTKTNLITNVKDKNTNLN